jgi:hypothetical protein
MKVITTTVSPLSDFNHLKGLEGTSDLFSHFYLLIVFNEEVRSINNVIEKSTKYALIIFTI